MFYNEKGRGMPLVMLHGNGGSQKMLKTEVKYYSKYFRVMAFDLPGHGRSDRIDDFEGDFWRYAAFLIKEILNQLKIDEFYTIGTSGGAVVALHLAVDPYLKCTKVVADSFEGLEITKERARQIAQQREKTIKINFFKMFFHYLHGKDWHTVLNSDSRWLMGFAEKQRYFFDDLGKVKIPVLLTCLRKDNMITNSVDKMESVKKQLEHATMHVFEKGNHPAMLTNKKKYRRLVCQFLS